MKQKLHFSIAVALLLSSSLMINAQVRITETMSSSTATTGTPDWFELTNIGSTAIDITGWKVDDSSYAYASALPLNGVTSIPAGKSVIFIETSTPETTIAAFKVFWGSSVDNVSFGSYTGSGIGLSSGGDGIVIFDASGVEITPRITVPSATTTPGKSFYFSYNSSGILVNNGILSTVGTILGSQSNQVTISSVGVSDIGSPGTAIIFPLSANVYNPDYKPWTLYGNKLKFDVLPTSNIEIFALTGSKVAVYEPTKEINLILNKGLYVLKVDNKATKIMIK